MPKLVVVGGMAAGMSGASKVKRLHPEWEALVLEAGEDRSYGACGLPYWIGGVTPEAESLYALGEEAIARRGIELRLRQRVEEILEGKKSIVVSDLASGKRYEETYDALLVATGAKALLPEIDGLDGENCFTVHDMGDGRRLSRFLEEEHPRSALVWGTGYIGLEMVENLAARGISVTMVNRSLRMLKSLVSPLKTALLEELESHEVKVFLETEVLEVLREGDRVRGLRTDRGTFSADLLLVATGVGPATEFLRDSPLPLAANGALRVDDRCATGVHGVWAAGDCCEVTHLMTGRPAYVPLGTTANKMGRVAGSNIAGERAAFPGILGTAVTKVFGLEIGVTGLTAGQAEKAGFDAVECTIKGRSRAGYYPGGGRVFVNLAAERSGRLLGGQVAGTEGTKGRVDTLAAALTGGMTVDQLSMMDAAYAPPFAPVWDPLLVAAGVLKGKL